MAHDREVAGIRCMEVLDALPDYLDNALDPVTRAKVDAHLAGCSWCAQFGGSYASTATALKLLARPPRPEEDPEGGT